MPQLPRRTACALAVAIACSGCNALLGVEPLKSGPDAGPMNVRELAALAADGGETNKPADGGDGDSDGAATATSL